MIFGALDAAGIQIRSREYYSVGGGFVVDEDAAAAELGASAVLVVHLGDGWWFCGALSDGMKGMEEKMWVENGGIPVCDAMRNGMENFQGCWLFCPRRSTRALSEG